MSFETFWARLLVTLKSGDSVKNWTVAKGYLGDTFTIEAVSDAAVKVKTPNAANIQRIPKRDFKLMHSRWKEYCSGQIQRHELREDTRFSKYTISIIKYLEGSRLEVAQPRDGNR